ncbi:LysR family transcriptional regulator [Sodalis glossinidius]|uniref:helix-turn-helix domain-containing protein n=1 Tax=Sodalis glossinidius TaxID=63612 RepID=UPI00311CAD32
MSRASRGFRVAKRSTDRLGDLKAFAAIANAGGFRQAARLLHVSPSGLSDAVRRLESHLGVCLLHRTTRSIHTADGERKAAAGAHWSGIRRAFSSGADRPFNLQCRDRNRTRRSIGRGGARRYLSV